MKMLPWITTPFCCDNKSCFLFHFLYICITTGAVQSSQMGYVPIIRGWKFFLCSAGSRLRCSRNSGIFMIQSEGGSISIFPYVRKRKLLFLWAWRDAWLHYGLSYRKQAVSAHSASLCQQGGLLVASLNTPVSAASSFLCLLSWS